MEAKTEETAVKVTMRDVYELLIEVRDEVRSMRPLPNRIDDHETRIRNLEKRVWQAAGAAAALGGAAGLIAQQLLGA